MGLHVVRTRGLAPLKACIQERVTAITGKSGAPVGIRVSGERIPPPETGEPREIAIGRTEREACSNARAARCASECEPARHPGC